MIVSAQVWPVGRTEQRAWFGYFSWLRCPGCGADLLIDGGPRRMEEKIKRHNKSKKHKKQKRSEA